jgi:ABC-type dipeptide/oligopeptide/nickel transport system ATPase component
MPGIGRIVESGPVLDVIRNSRDDYTKLLLRSLPNPFAAQPQSESI